MQPTYTDVARITSDLFDADELKGYAGVPEDDDTLNAELTNTGRAAQEYVQQLIDRTWGSTTRTDYYGAWDRALVLSAKLAASAVPTVKYLDADGAEQTVDAADYTVDRTAGLTRINFGQTSPTHQLSASSTNAVSVSYSEGVNFTTDADPPLIGTADKGQYAIHQAIIMKFKSLWGRTPDAMPASIANEEITALLLPFTRFSF